MNKKRGFVYIITNKRNGILYVGVTSNLEKRVQEHKLGVYEGFSKKYNLRQLVYYEEYPTILEAIEREKQIKGGSRKKKLSLIDSFNPKWNDLAEHLS